MLHIACFHLQQLELEKHAKLCNVRLVKYDELHDSLERSYEDMDDEPISVVLGGVKSIYTFDLLMEIKKPDQEFQEYKPGGKNYDIYTEVEGYKKYLQKSYLLCVLKLTDPVMLY